MRDEENAGALIVARWAFNMGYRAAPLRSEPLGLLLVCRAAQSGARRRLDWACSERLGPRGRRNRFLKYSGAASIALRCFSLLLVWSSQAFGQITASQYDVEAAYLFNFGKFVRPAPAAPPELRSTFNICIIGDDPLGPALEGIAANERLDGRPVRVERMRSVSDSPSCDIAYFSASEEDRIGKDLSAFTGTETLTVADSSDFLKNGGMIQFILVANHVRFAVNLDAVRQNRLVLSSELLRVASSITGGPQPETKP